MMGDARTYLVGKEIRKIVQPVQIQYTLKLKENIQGINRNVTMGRWFLEIIFIRMVDTARKNEAVRYLKH